MIRPWIYRARIDLRRLDNGNVETLRIAGGGDRSHFRFGGGGGEQYRSGLADAPRFRMVIGFDDNGWTGGVIPTTGELRWAPSKAADYAAYSNGYLWKDAAITVERGREGHGGETPAAWEVVLVGAVGDMAAEDGLITIRVADLSQHLDKPIATAKFAGTGGLEGPEEAEGRPKRRTWGKVFNVEGRILDKANSIYEFSDPNFQLNAIPVLRDKGRAADPAPTVIAWQGSAAATLAALQAANAAQGSGVVAPSIACCKWWTQPAGPLTADLEGEIGSGYSDKAGTIAARIASTALGFDPVLPADRNALDALRPDSVGTHIEGETMTFARALDWLLSGISIVWVLNPAGNIKFFPFDFAGPVETLRSDAALRQRVMPPVKARKLGYQRNYRQHSDGEIAASIPVDDVAGIGDLAKKNRIGGRNLMPDGSFEIGLPARTEVADGGAIAWELFAVNAGHGEQFARLDATVSTHQVHFTGSLFRHRRARNEAAISVLLKDSQNQSSAPVGGAPDNPPPLVVVLAPTLGSSVGAIESAPLAVAAGQAWEEQTAVLAGLVMGQDYYIGFKLNPALGRRRLDVDALMVTPGDTPSSFAGDLQGHSFARLGRDVRRQGSLNLVSDADAITSLGTAQAIAGQGAYATRNSVAFGESLLTGFGALAGRATTRLGFEVRRANDTTIVNDADAITSLGTAQAITGQGALATQNVASSTQIPLIEGANIIQDPYFDQWGVANMWSPGMVDGGSVPTLADTSDPEVLAMAVKRAAKFDATGAAASSRSRATFGNTTTLPAKGGDFYRIKALGRVKAGFNGQFQILVEARNADGSFNTSRSIDGPDYRSSPAPADATLKLSGIGAPISALPDSAAFIRVMLQVRWAAAPAGTGYLSLAEVRPTLRLNDQITRENGSTPLTDADAVTSQGTAAAITGQGALATKSLAAWGLDISGRPAELTDGRVAAGLTPAGDIARDVPVSRADSSNLLRRAAGGLFTGELAADVTATHTAAAIAGQGALATKSAVDLATAEVTGKSLANLDSAADLKLGGIEANATVGGFFGGNLLESSGGVTATVANFKTSQGTAAAITGQSDWATYSAVAPTTMANRTQNLNNSGRVSDYRGFTSNRSYGIRAVYSGPSFSDTWVGANDVTINIGASTLTTDTGTNLNLPSGSLTNCAAATKFYIFRTMTNPGSSTGSYGKSTTLAGAMDPDKVYLGHWTTRASSGSSGGGGGGGIGDCVAASAFVPASLGEIMAELVEAGEPIRVLDERSRNGAELAAVERNALGREPCVTLITESGIRLTLAQGTPLTLADLSTVLAPNGLGHRIPVEDAEGFRWERIAEVRYAGQRFVSHISVGGRTYAAGDEPGRYLFTHNQVKP